MLELLAAAPGADGPPAWLQILPWVGILGVFWFLVLRPQIRKQKDHQKKIEAIKKGDKVVTGGGLVGKVAKVDDNYAEIDIAKGVRVKAVKNTIGDVIPPGGGAAND